ncbi:hypothetical protein [Vibrio harveyi]|uniref:hypothetical protein n=1 Tax=Vibrio harveyi TaxID=669 RepID=UPI003CF676AC
MRKKVGFTIGLAISVCLIVIGLLGPYLSYEAQSQVFATSSMSFGIESQKMMTAALHQKDWMTYIPSVVWYGLSVAGVLLAWFFIAGLVMIKRNLPVRTLFTKKYWSSYYGGELFYREIRTKKKSAFRRNQ